MSNTITRSIKPTHPGEMLREDFITDYDLTVTGLARPLGLYACHHEEAVSEKGCARLRCDKLSL